MPLITVHSIVCDKTQEAVDEVQVQLRCDGSDISHDAGGILGPYTMDDGDEIKIDREFPFSSNFQIKLYECDTTNPDDYLGGASITTPYPNDLLNLEQSQKLSRRGGEYRVFYVVSEENHDQFGLSLQELRCTNAQEATDEIYIVVNGVKATDTISMRTGSIHSFYDTDSGPIIFNRTATVEVWERDLLRSNMIDSRLIDEALVDSVVGRPGSYHEPLSFHHDSPGSATYYLTYAISRVPYVIPEGPSG